jgi:hypothetical protein
MSVRGVATKGVVVRTASHLLPLLESLPWPPHNSTHVFWLAWHHVWRSSGDTVLGATEQHGMGVLEVVFCADAKPAKAEAATMMVE